MTWNPKPLDPADVTVHRHGSGTPLVLIHCLGMNWHFWDVLAPLADRYELVAYSLPGHHDTPLPGHQYGQDETTAQLKALLDREGIRRAHFAGISMGGSMVQHFAGTHPGMVEKAILCDCTPRYDEESRANWPNRAAVARSHGVSALIPQLSQTFFTAPSLAANGPDVQFVKRSWAECSGEGYALACEWLAKVDAREQAQRMTMPTLVLLGSNERQSFQDAATWMTSNIPGAKGKVVVPEAGHASVRERPDFCARAFSAFLG